LLVQIGDRVMYRLLRGHWHLTIWLRELRLCKQSQAMPAIFNPRYQKKSKQGTLSQGSNLQCQKAASSIIAHLLFCYYVTFVVLEFTSKFTRILSFIRIAQIKCEIETCIMLLVSLKNRGTIVVLRSHVWAPTFFLVRIVYSGTLIIRCWSCINVAWVYMLHHIMMIIWSIKKTSDNFFHPSTFVNRKKTSFSWSFAEIYVEVMFQLVYNQVCNADGVDINVPLKWKILTWFISTNFKANVKTKDGHDVK